MAIAALPEATVRLLGSTQALTTPDSLVKELIENALDAKATHIDILISPNTIDKIEVRDNGHGIQLEDLDALGRRGHTSKIRSFEDLRTVGGISLGFRGEALFSAVQLGQVSMVTKTEGEATAVSVKLKPLGGVEKQTRASHPLGTTISVTNFLFKLPVRHQTALKEAPKTLAKIKELLRSYSLARRNVKLNLKVTKGGKGSCSFAPRSNDSIKDVVSQIIGRDVASQCTEKYISFSDIPYQGGTYADDGNGAGNGESSPNGQTEDRFAVTIFLPSLDADLSKISYGQYISIDGRPVSHDKGIMKRIVTIFKRYMRGYFSDTSDKIKNPFLLLSIHCPEGTYDPNVEPAKDDVLFSNEYLVLENIEQAFKDMYGEANSAITLPSAPASSRKTDNFEPRSGPGVSMFQTQNSRQLSDDGILDVESVTEPRKKALFPSPGAHNQRRGGLVDMSNNFSEGAEPGLCPDKGSLRSEAGERDDLDEQDQSLEPLNPWRIAKLTAPIRRGHGESSISRERPADYLLTPHHSSDAVFSEANIISPVRAKSHTQNLGRNTFRSLTSEPSHEGRPQNHCPKVLGEDTSIMPSSDDDLFVPDTQELPIHRRNDFVSARNITNSQLMTPSFHSYTTNKRKGINKPFISPLQNSERTAEQDGFRQAKLTLAPRSGITNATPVEGDHDAELAWAMDFENRKEEATRRRREQLRTPRIATPLAASHIEDLITDSMPKARTSPHKNRYNAALATLNSGDTSPPLKQLVQTSLPDNDPRGFLLRRQKSLLKPGGTSKMTRHNSVRLPLESIPRRDQLHSLQLRVSGGIDHVQQSHDKAGTQDLHINRGVQRRGLALSPVDEKRVLDRLRDVVDAWVERAGEPEAEVEVEYDLHALHGST